MAHWLQMLAGEDWPLWRDARVAALSDTDPVVAADWARTTEANWRQWLGDTTGLHLVAVADDEPIGIVRGSQDGNWAWLSSLWVARPARGLGIGAELIDAVESWARRRARMLLLCVAPDNEVALGIYRRRGFIESGLPGPVTDEGQRELVLRKRLVA